MLKEEGSLTKGDREMIVTVTSAANRCLYCVVAHGALHAHGFDEEDIWDIAAITSFFGLSNRMVSFSGMQPNPEFYLLGRVPREKKR